ncbi:MAG: hypothetical protein LPL29_01970 [Alphaproteobacteria bacterium]|mgnify:CR=1 FL=1|nr:hypothetical protein [Alphaproteobacteria bacterium]MDX5368118.1 hypothetical protein [Alphaproteobacteria bacterium]
MNSEEKAHVAVGGMNGSSTLVPMLVCSMVPATLGMLGVILFVSLT